MASSLANIVQVAKLSIGYVKDIQGLSKEYSDLIADFAVFLQLVQEVQQDLLASDHSLLSPSAEVMMKRCASQSENVSVLLDKMVQNQRRRGTFGDGSKVLEVEKAVNAFKTSVILLRQLKTEYVL